MDSVTRVRKSDKWHDEPCDVDSEREKNVKPKCSKESKYLRIHTADLSEAPMRLSHSLANEQV